MKTLNKLWIAATFSILLFLSTAVIGSSHADTAMIGLGDIGCKDSAKKNLGNIATSGIPMIGAGDYRYDCKVSSIQPLWDKISVKHGPYGNHDVESSTSKTFTKTNMGLGTKGWFSWRIADLAIIGINQYADYKKGSEQYTYLQSKTTQFCGRTDISWVIYTMHQPFQTPSFGGGHGPDKATRDNIGPIIKQCQATNNQNVLVLEGHNHGVAFGNVDGLNHAICGGGGQGGDTLGGLNGFEYGSIKAGYCLFSFGQTTATVQHRGTDNKILEEFAFY
jgi:hypothetical protein